MEKTPAPTIRDLYPHLTEEELIQAEDQLERYLALVLRIFDRVESESPGRLTEILSAIRCEGKEEQSSP